MYILRTGMLQHELTVGQRIEDMVEIFIQTEHGCNVIHCAGGPLLFHNGAQIRIDRSKCAGIERFQTDMGFQNFAQVAGLLHLLAVDQAGKASPFGEHIHSTIGSQAMQCFTHGNTAAFKLGSKAHLAELFAGEQIQTAAATAALTACGGSSSSTAASTSSAASTAAPTATASNASVVLKFDLTVSLEHPWGLAATEFKNRIEEKSGGSMTVEIYPSSTSGSEADSLAGMLVGTTSMTMSGGSFNGYAPSATLLEAPWAYNSEEDVQAMCESDIGKGIMQDFEDAGFKVLWYQLRGPRELTSNVPINKASDLQGRKMRMSGNVLHNSMWTAAGAITSAIALSETFNALSQGVVEMQENPYDMIYDNSFYEVQKYVNQTNHVYSTIFNLLSVDIWNGLSEDQQNIITETSNEMQDWTNEYYFAHKDEYLEKLKETGMQVNEDVDRDDIKNAMMPAIEEFLKSQPGDLWTTYQAICDLSNS